MAMRIKTVLSNKGKVKLNVDGYDYVKERETATSKTWTCSVKECKGRCQTNIGMTEILRQPTAHTCSRMKTEAQIEAEEKFKSILHNNILSKPSQILTKLHGEVESSVTIPSDKQLRERIAYKRRKEFGLSENVARDDTNKIIQSATTIDGDNFILHKSDADDIIIFGTTDNLRRLMENPTWMADGTFSLAPKNYHQLYIFSAKIYNL